MASVGPYLRELREQKGISLDEIARATRIAPRFLEALEADEQSALPERVFTKGFIRAYCQALGEPPDEAFARFEGQNVAAAPVVASPAPPEPPRSRVRGTIVVSFVLLLVLGAALLALTWATRETRLPDPASPARPTVGPSPGGPAPSKPATPAKAAPADAPEPPATPGPTAKAPPAPAGPATAPSGPPPAASAAGGSAPSALSQIRDVHSPYRLVARAREATWMSVKIKDGRSTEETIPAGETREWTSNSPFVITIGNAGGVSLELNGHALPSLGARGAAVFRVQLPPEGP
jgi:cytoskeletal protein RodZ